MIQSHLLHCLDLGHVMIIEPMVYKRETTLCPAPLMPFKLQLLPMTHTE